MSRQWLATHPDDAERVRSWARDGRRAACAFTTPSPTKPIPRRLEIERLVRQPRKWIYGAIAATLVAFVAGGGVGWVARGAGRFAIDVPEFHAGCAGRAPALRGRGSPSGRGAWQRGARICSNG